MSRKLEALVDAIGNFNGSFSNPESTAYKLRNPLLIESFGLPGKHQTDVEGRRVFDSFLSGYRAALFDIEIKITGRSRAKLHTTDTLANLLRVYKIHDSISHKKISSFLRRALQDETISSGTPLTFFTEPDAVPEGTN